MKVIIAGDFCPEHRTARLIEEARYAEILDEVKPVIKSADYSIVNFECPVAESNEAKPIVKRGPNLRCTRKAVNVIKEAGFKGVTLANNHILDFGAVGVSETITACKDKGLDIVGAGESLIQASKTLYKEVNGRVLGIYNCCEHEFSTADIFKGGGNPLNPVRQFYAIKEARKKADFVVMIVHGGQEHYQLPSPRMKETYRYFIDCGADAVVNHHQHCYSGYEIYNGKPIFYGLGNFCFDDGKTGASTARGIWNEGYMAEITLGSDSVGEAISFRLIPYVQCAEEPKVRLMTEEEEREFEKNILALNETISDDEKLIKAYDGRQEQLRKNAIMPFTPYGCRILKSAYFRGLIPSMISQEKLLTIFNSIMCESHRESVLYLLNKIIRQKI